MAFSDPITVTIGGAAKNLVRVDSGKYQSEYLLSEATTEYRMVIRSQNQKSEADGRYKVRHNISLTIRVFATPTTPEIIRRSSAVIEHYAGDDVTVYDDGAIAVAGLLTAANIAKLNNYES